MAYFLAVDAGGTKTSCLLADELRVLARASTGTVKLMRVGEQEATARMQSMLRQAELAAGFSLRQVAAACAGLAGVSIPEVRQWGLRTLGSIVAGPLEVCGDEEIALDAAFRGGPGILVVAGTGSNVVGRCATGEMFNAGGWGPAVGDEGSGHWIGVEAVRAGLWARDRGIPTALLDAVTRYWGLGTVADLVAKANERPGPDFAELAPVVARCSYEGDEVAAGILDHAGEELAEQVTVVREKMLAGSCLGETEEIGVAYTGSVLGQIGPVRRAMVRRFTQSLPSLKMVEGPVDALAGALWRARAQWSGSGSRADAN